MLEDSVDFMSKKAQFQHVQINVNTVKLVQYFCILKVSQHLLTSIVDDTHAI